LASFGIGGINEAVNIILGYKLNIDILINNAGYGLMSPMETATQQEVLDQFQTNVFGPLSFTQLLLPTLRTQKYGRIINVSSVAGKMTVPGNGFYCSTKHALEAISDALRMEIRPFGLEVVIINPGPIKTNFVHAFKINSKSFEESSPYKKLMDKSYDVSKSLGSDKPILPTASPEQAARVIYHAATTKKPRIRYAITWIADLSLIFRRLLPDRLFDVLSLLMYK
jgi:short-subunit dehydrogenase